MVTVLGVSHYTQQCVHSTCASGSFVGGSSQPCVGGSSQPCVKWAWLKSCMVSVQPQLTRKKVSKIVAFKINVEWAIRQARCYEILNSPIPLNRRLARKG